MVGADAARVAICVGKRHKLQALLRCGCSD